MHRLRTLTAGIGATAVVGMMFAGATSAGAATSAATVKLAGSTAPFTAHATATGNVAASQKLTIQVWLKQKASAATYANAVSTPGSKLFHHYLSPRAYTARYAASKSQAGQVSAWLKGQGFGAVSTSPTRTYVRATGSAAKVNATFSTQLKTYKATAGVRATRGALRANSRALSVPRSLASSVLGVTGLNNAAPVLPMLRPSVKTQKGTAKSTAKANVPALPCSNYYGQHIGGGLPSQFGTTKFPTDICGYSGQQLRHAYGANTANTGKGQTIALVELGLTQDMFDTLVDYAHANGLPAPSAERYSELSIGQGTECGDLFDVEEQLDVESSYAQATGAKQIVIGGDSCNEGDDGLQGLFDADLAVLGSGSHPLATVASNSWEGGDEGQPAFLTNIEHAYLVRAAAEGVGMYFSSGDGSGVEAPSNDPDAISVGGTTLGIGKTSNRIFETGWSTGISVLDGSAWDFLGEQGAAGGGPSVTWAQPAYQKGVVPASLSKAPGNRPGKVRSAPDISAVGDPFTGMAVGLLDIPSDGSAPTYFQTDIGGTSLAAPLVAGIVTAAQQGQSHPFGFINPAIYKMHGTSAFHDALPLTSSSPALWKGVACSADDCGEVALTTFDDQSFNMSGYTGQVTLKGYDSMSGLGTPNGQSFITALRKLG
jgi:subtilase family serine protease